MGRLVLIHFLHYLYGAKGFLSPRIIYHIIYMRKALLLTLLLMPLVAAAQQRVSIDVKTVQVADGQKVTTERSLYLHPDGRLIAEQHRPIHLVSLSNALGEMKIYDPQNNKVAAMNNRDMSSSKEMVAIFSSGNYADMSLGDYGFIQSDVREEDGLIIKSYTTRRSEKGVASVELVFQNQLPICMIYYDANKHPLRKVYFARYEYGRIPMPMRITEIEYNTPQDSVVRLSTYSKLLTGKDATSPMFDYQIPADAERTDVDLNKLLQ